MYRRIMVTLDGSELAECVLPHVESIASGCGVGEVVLVRAVAPFYMPASGEGMTFSKEDIKKIDASNKASAKEYLEKVAGKLKLGGATVKTEVVMGKIAESITEYATRNDVDLLAIATHGLSGVSRWVWGSVADRILHSACVPVLMVRPPSCVPRV